MPSPTLNVPGPTLYIPRCPEAFRGGPSRSQTIFQRISDLWSSLPRGHHHYHQSLCNSPDTIISSTNRIRTIAITPNNFLMVLKTTQFPSMNKVMPLMGFFHVQSLHAYIVLDIKQTWLKTRRRIPQPPALLY